MSTEILTDPRQMSIEFEPGSRKSDPETSRMAATQAKEMAAKHHRMIVDVLSQYGPLGKDGIASRLRGLDGVAVCRRLTELQRAGRITPTGRNVQSTAGRQEREWSAS
jgi:hypothetical protein